MLDEDDTVDAPAFEHDGFALEGAAFGDEAPEMPEMSETAAFGEPVPAGKPNLDLIMDIPVTMQVVLGKASMPVANLVKLGRGAVVKLDTSVGDPVDLMVNGRVVARGEVVVLENEGTRFGITLTEIVSPGARPARSRAVAA